MCSLEGMDGWRGGRVDCVGILGGEREDFVWG